MPALVPQPKNWTGGTGALYAGGIPGNRGGGRTPSKVKELAAAKLPPHVDTLDDIANGKAVVSIVQKCPKCGHEPEDGASTEPLVVRPGERVRAIEVLTKLADTSELIVTSENSRAFFDCVSRALDEIVDGHLVGLVHERAIELFKALKR